MSNDKMSEPTFQQLSDALPVETNWTDELLPEVARHIWNAALSSQEALSQSEPDAINIVSDWPPCNPACEYKDPHGGLHDKRSASCSCDAAKCSIAKQNLKSEPVQVSQPVTLETMFLMLEAIMDKLERQAAPVAWLSMINEVGNQFIAKQFKEPL